MAHAEICPICHGRGKIRNPEDITTPMEITCHGCGGKGWIEVSNERSYYPFPYSPKPYPNWPKSHKPWRR